MKLSEALEHLKLGDPMHRTGWNPQDGYVQLMKGMTHVWKITLHPNPNAGNYIFSLADLLAEDWEHFVLPAPAEPAKPEEPIAPAA